MIFHEKLQKLMDERKLTFRDVAEATGVGTATAFRWASHGKPLRPRLDEAFRLAELLGVPLDYLADDSLDEPRPGLSAGDRHILLMVQSLGSTDEAIRRLMRSAPGDGPA